MSTLYDKFKIRGILFNGKIFFKTYPNVVQMPKTRELLIGFDESHKQTGMYVETVDGTAVTWIDFVNEGDLPASEYRRLLKGSLMRMFDGCKVRLIVTERPYGGAPYTKLKQLQSFIHDLKYEIAAFSDSEYDDILTSTWRKHFIPKDDEKGKFTREKAKRAVKSQCIKLHPILENYKKYMSADGDSCEAEGVLKGYLAENYPDGIDSHRKISKTMEKKNHKFFYNVHEVPVQTWMQDITAKYKSFFEARGLELMEYNNEMSIEENAHRATGTTNKIIVSPIEPNKEYLVFAWDQCKMWSNGSIFVMVAYRKEENQYLD